MGVLDREAVRDYLSRTLRFEGVERELRVAVLPQKVTAIVGPRRAGKTFYLLYLKDRVYPDALYLNFENVFLRGIGAREFFDVIKIYVEMYGREPRALLLDEIQEVRDWDALLRTLLDYGYLVVATGSSSKLLSREIATQLRGRAIHYLLLPFSFREFLRAKGVTVSPHGFASRGVLLRFLREYLDWGGFPEVVLTEDVSLKERILRTYFDETFVRDFVERHRIRSVELARLLFEFVFQNFAGELSIRRIENYLRGRVPLSRKTIYSYLERLEDTLSVFFVDRYSKSVYARRSWPRKVYVADTGVTRFLRFEEEMGKLMENAVFLELLRRSNERPAQEIYYWRDGVEVDFVVREGNRLTELIQVTYASGRDEVDRREIRALERVSALTGCRRKTVITWDYEGEEKGVRFLPLWRFLGVREGRGA